MVLVLRQRSGVEWWNLVSMFQSLVRSVENCETRGDDAELEEDDPCTGSQQHWPRGADHVMVSDLTSDEHCPSWILTKSDILRECLKKKNWPKFYKFWNVLGHFQLKNSRFLRG